MMLKEDIRTTYKEKRAQMSDDERKELSAKILELTLEHFDLEGKKISLFLPIERHREILTWDLLKEKNSRFYLPIVKTGGRLVHICYESEGQIEVSDFGIPEPIYGTVGAPTEFDLVIVPLLAIDKKGHRVGYGAGFYDKFLKECREDCKFVGLSFFDPIENIGDMVESDIPLHYCVHPNGVESFGT